MKISVKVAIEMTPEQIKDLADEYGFDPERPAEVRDFVKSYLRELAQQSTAAQFWTATAS